MNPSIFNFNEHGVRIVLDDSKEPWFCLTDVCKSLDISRTSRLFRELDPKGVADYHTLQMAVFKNSSLLMSRIYIDYLSI
jgi:prophage antirepressor-like protein